MVTRRAPPVLLCCGCNDIKPFIRSICAQVRRSVSFGLIPAYSMIATAGRQMPPWYSAAVLSRVRISWNVRIGILFSMIFGGLISAAGLIEHHPFRCAVENRLLRINLALRYWRILGNALLRCISHSGAVKVRTERLDNSGEHFMRRRRIYLMSDKVRGRRCFRSARAAVAASAKGTEHRADFIASIPRDMHCSVFRMLLLLAFSAL